VRIEGITVGPFQENSWLVVDEPTRRGVLIDPGDDGDAILAMVQRAGVAIDAIWLTHAHIDHIGAVAAVTRVWDVPVHLHPADIPVWDAAPRVAAMYGLPFDMPERAPDRALADGELLRCGALTFEVRHFPGHAPGLVAFIGQGVAIAGDLLFRGSIGRTDLPLGDPAQMQASLDRFALLPPETVVYPGHGETTTLRDELRANPFLNGTALVRGA